MSLQPVTQDQVAVSVPDVHEQIGQRAAALLDQITRPRAAPDLYLPADFWQTRDILAIVENIAQARLVSPDAVLHAVLARTAAFAGQGSSVDVGRGRAPLNYFTAVIAPSGAGKTCAATLAEQLLPAPVATLATPAPLSGISVGSGEGIAEAYMGEVRKPNPSGTGRPLLVREQVRYSVFFEVDEGQTLTKLMTDRQGSTLGSALRTAWTGRPLGQANATSDRSRHVRDYSMGLLVGFQPSSMGPVFAEAGLGTPQRFTYCLAVPRHIPAYDERTEIDSVPDLSPAAWGSSWHVAAREPIRREVYGMIADRASGVPVPELDTHEPLMLAKLAGLFAILDTRQMIDEMDWWLARTVWSTSQRVRDWVRDQLKTTEAEQDAEQAARKGRMTALVNDTVHARTVERVGRLIARKLAAENEPVLLAVVTRAIAGRDRAVKDEALAWAVEQGLVRVYPGDDDSPSLYGAG